MPTTSTPRTPEGALIRQARENAGLSIPKAAEMAGMSASQWGNIERGYRNDAGRAEVTATPAKLAAMARTVGVSPELLTRAGREDGAARLALLPELSAASDSRDLADSAAKLFPGDSVAAAIMGQLHKPLAQRQRELAKWLTSQDIPGQEEAEA